ncbi:MAG: cation diffusion facilitator family transporter [Oscillospiraceae bacterium]|nr:cation diffusion facilitator family transporter [Oscillospiraceae bacterium]
MNRKKAQVAEGAVSIIVNFILFALKFLAGILTGSIALIADAWHTLSDSLSSVFVILAAKLAARKPDKEHPFGHGRWELISTLIIAFLLAFIGFEFFSGSIEKFKNRESVEYGTLAIIVTIASVVVKELLAQFAFYLGRKTKNSVVSADGWHHRTDALSSIVILIGIVVTKFVTNLWWMDSVLGMACAAMIFFAAIQIMREAITKILGEEPEHNLKERITEEALKIYENDLQIHHIHLHDYISQKELTLHIMLDENMTIKDSHKVATVIENMIKDKFDMVATIHVEPRKSEA